jgi:sugar/nucleoside kinase (ribokinase family)
MKPYHIYGIGNALVDNDYEIDDALLTQLAITKNSHQLIDDAHRMRLQVKLNKLPCKRNCGGSIANSLTIAQQLGGRCYYACRLGNDANGQYYRDELTHLRIANPYDQQNLVEGHTGTCFVLVTADGQRSLQTHLGVTETLSTAELNKSALQQADYIYLEGFLAAQPTALKAALQTRDMGQHAGVNIAISLSDPFITEHFRGELTQLLATGVDLLFCNETEALSFTTKSTLADALGQLRQFAKRIIITRGVQGSLIDDGQQSWHIPAIRTSVIDTVGAGDTYSGTFIYALCQQYDFVTAAHMATYAATQIIGKFTARFDTQEAQTLKQALHENFSD